MESDKPTSKKVLAREINRTVELLNALINSAYKVGLRVSWTVISKQSSLGDYSIPYFDFDVLEPILWDDLESYL